MNQNFHFLLPVLTKLITVFLIVSFIISPLSMVFAQMVGDSIVSQSDPQLNPELLQSDSQPASLHNPELLKSDIAPINSPAVPPDILIPENPGKFDFTNEPVKITNVPNISIRPGKGVASDSKSLTSSISFDTAIIADGNIIVNDLPILDDVSGDNGEIIINSTITNLAASLDNNPVKIYNYIRNSIEYEPYFSAKKGALGCLAEKLCNDTDASSLTIALLRAAGIPARYKKDLVIMSTDQLKDLLGVDETKTVYAALFKNEIPIYLISDNEISPDFETYDFSSVSMLALEWTYAEAFYEYDERGGNISNTLSIKYATTTEQVRDLFAPFPKKQWISLDAIVKPYARVRNEIVSNTVNFNTLNFWNGFLSYQGGQNPLEKYVSELQAVSGKNINNPAYQSTRQYIADEFQILPPALPYLLGVLPGFTTEVWSRLPDNRRMEVIVTLKKDSDKSIILEKKFFGSEINNVPLDLFYQGATENDKTIIESHGGIYATPATLVEIVPFLSLSFSMVVSTIPIKIGDNMILQFDYIQNGQIEHTDQKFSVAGNQEGIYISLSRPLPDPLIDNEPSKILLEGNSALAKQYLLKINNNIDSYKKALDISVNTVFSRAVATQSRILNTVNNLPTTFDFKGLTLDASLLVNNYSNRGYYKDNDKDIHLLVGLDGSYHEGQIFNDIAGLDGISTVKGLQYAYAHPANYTIHTITSGNESVIDTLQLSANTKQNMHVDVQKGNTIITPNKFVANGAWNGILYISLEPDGTGTYAIGEQSQQNGGFTVAIFNEREVGRFINEGSVDNFIFADSIMGGDRKCRIAKTTFLGILGQSGYGSQYGLPCMMETKTFGTVNHTYIILTDGAKFYSPGKYDYWKKENEVMNMFDNYITQKKQLSQNDIGYLSGGKQYTFKFSITLGTYIQSICENGGFINCGDHATLYYSPNQSEGNVFRARSDILSKLEENNQLAVRQLGLPIGDEISTEGGKDQTAQPFLMGWVYKYTKFGLIKTQYTYGNIALTHQQNGGFSGYLKYPVNDAQQGNDGNMYQEFGGKKEIRWNGNFSSSAEIIELRKYRCELNYGNNPYNIFNNAQLDLITLLGLTDSAIGTVEGLLDLGEMIWYSIIDLPVTFGKIGDAGKSISDALINFNVNDFWNDAKDKVPQTVVLMKQELDDLVKNNSCPSRVAYIKGRITGEVLLALVPYSKIGTVGKIKLLEETNILAKVKNYEVVIYTIKGYSESANLARSVIAEFPLLQLVFNKWTLYASKDSRWKVNMHHIIPSSFRDSEAYGSLIIKLDNLWGGAGKFELNSSLNGVGLPNVLHPGSHLGSYNRTIFKRLDDFTNLPGLTKEKIIQELKSIRNDILSGDIKPNNSWDLPENREFLDEIMNSKQSYQ